MLSIAGTLTFKYSLEIDGVNIQRVNSFRENPLPARVSSYVSYRARFNLPIRRNTINQCQH